MAFAAPIIQQLAGERLHLSHGPIDVVLKAWGAPDALRAAYDAAGRRFPAILPELAGELAALRRPMHERPAIESPVARRMVAACAPFAGIFITPMAAVAGAVADELLAHMTAAAPLQRAYVNDGGDIAVLVTEGHVLDVGVAGEFSRGDVPAINGRLRLEAGSGVGGIATSGARGRSFSLGIADSVTVLAATAAQADAAATLIANAVDIDSPAVMRRPARDLDPDSDLRDLPVTVSVGPLMSEEIDAALAAGLARAREFFLRGLIRDAALMLAGEVRSLSSRPERSSEPGPRSRRGFILGPGYSLRESRDDNSAGDTPMNVDIRKIVVCTEETRHDGGPPLSSPVRKAWAAGVVKNPYAGRYEPDIMPMMEALKPLGLELSRRLIAALGGDAKAIDAYGKGVIVGTSGEIEHSALWHVPGGYAMRELLGRALAIVPSACKIGAVGAALDLPIHHKDACYVRSRFDAMTVMVPDAPRPDELLFALTMAAGGRPHARAGGLEVSEISKMDGQR